MWNRNKKTKYDHAYNSREASICETVAKIFLHVDGIIFNLSLSEHTIKTALEFYMFNL